jgi:hypothetical protein
VTHPGVPVSPGHPALDYTAQQAIHAARSRVDALTRGQFPFPVKKLSEEEKEGALRSAKDDICLLCGGIHPAPNTPACPRLATFKCNPDGRITEGTFWPDGIQEETVKLNGKGEVVSTTVRRSSNWDTSRTVFASELAEEEDGAGDDASAG